MSAAFPATMSSSKLPPTSATASTSGCSHGMAVRMIQTISTFSHSAFASATSPSAGTLARPPMSKAGSKLDHVRGLERKVTAETYDDYLIDKDEQYLKGKLAEP